jgi:hypothetical protein
MLLVNAMILFAIGALGGLTMAVMHFRTHSAPRAVLAGAHGVFAASGLVTLVWAVAKIGGGHGAGIALALFLVAAAGGFTLLSFHLRGRPLPSALVIGHGLVAVAAFIVLFISAMALGA